MEPELELISSVAKATGIQSSLSGLPLPPRPRPCLSRPHPSRPWPHLFPSSSWWCPCALGELRRERIGVSKSWVRVPTRTLLACGSLGKVLNHWEPRYDSAYLGRGTLEWI